MAAQQPITVTAHPKEEQHTTVIRIYDNGDYVTVAGCSNPAILDSFSLKVIARNIKSQLESGQAGDRAMFVNQGIRQVREYQALKGERDRSVYFIFRENYEPKALDEIKKIVTSKYSADFAILDNVGALVNFINSRQDKRRFIKKMDLFSHGLVGSIEFGYDTGKAGSYRFREAQARMLKPVMFHDDAIITSYACRTGTGVDKESFEDGSDPQYSKSLAQILADCADVEVHAFLRRTDYGLTYGTKAQTEKAAKAKARVLEYDRQIAQYDKSVADYRNILAQRQAMLEEYRRSSGNPEAQAVPGLPTEAGLSAEPQPPVKNFTDEEEELARADMARSTNYEKYHLPIDPYGAVNPVGSFGTPKGLPEGKKVLKPVVWEGKK